MKTLEHDVHESIPRHINGDQSDMRGVKEGWYVINKVGKLTSGPFSTRDDCLSRLTRESRSAN